MLEDDVPSAMNDGQYLYGANSLANEFQQMRVEPNEADNQSVRVGNKVVVL